VTFGATTIARYCANISRTSSSAFTIASIGYFQVARETLERKSAVRPIAASSRGWGYSRNWIEPSVDLYISRTQTANDYAVKKGIPPNRARVRGYLMLPRASLEVLSVPERREFRSKRLGLDPIASPCFSPRAPTARTTTLTCSPPC